MLFLVLIKPNSVFSQENNAQESSQLDNNINYFADDSIILDINKKRLTYIKMLILTMERLFLTPVILSLILIPKQ